MPRDPNHGFSLNIGLYLKGISHFFIGLIQTLKLTVIIDLNAGLEFGINIGVGPGIGNMRPPKKTRCSGITSQTFSNSHQNSNCWDRGRSFCIFYNTRWHCGSWSRSRIWAFSWNISGTRSFCWANPRIF